MTDAASPMQPALGWLVTILVPIALAVAAVRLLLTPAFLQFEYRTPNFPADAYGFTQQDRLQWSEIALQYLNRSEDISFLRDLQFEDGSPVYNERELRHMVDVQNVLRSVLRVWYGVLAALAILGVWAWSGGWLPAFIQAVGRGGGLTAVLIGAILVLVVIAFGVFFVAFHQVFFQPGTWQFLYSDTLIRLFPERFWRDTFLVVGTLAGGAGLLLWYLLVRRPG